MREDLCYHINTTQIHHYPSMQKTILFGGAVIYHPDKSFTEIVIFNSIERGKRMEFLRQKAARSATA